MGSALLILVGDISNKLILESVVFWFLVSSNQSIQKATSKKRNFFGPLANTERKSLDSTLLIHVSDISKMLILESVVFWCWFSSNQSSLESA